VPVVTAAEQSQFQEIKQEVMDGLAVREAAALEIKTHAPGVTVDAGLEGVDDILSLLGEIDLAEPASFDKKSSDSTSITSQRASWPPLLFGAAPKAKPADHDHENHGPHA
jgi:hypothetical protein